MKIRLKDLELDFATTDVVDYLNQRGYTIKRITTATAKTGDRRFLTSPSNVTSDNLYNGCGITDSIADRRGYTDMKRYTLAAKDPDNLTAENPDEWDQLIEDREITAVFKACIEMSLENMLLNHKGQ